MPPATKPDATSDAGWQLRSDICGTLAALKVAREIGTAERIWVLEVKLNNLIDRLPRKAKP